MMVGEQYFVNRMTSASAATGSGRTDIWQFTWEHVLENPLWGIGLQGFRHLDFSQVQLTSSSHPHNIMLEILLESGFIGAGLLASFVIIMLIKTLWFTQRRVPVDRYGFKVLIMATGIAFLSYLIAGQFLTAFFRGWWLVYPTLLVALLGALTFAYRREESAAFSAAEKGRRGVSKTKPDS